MVNYQKLKEKALAMDQLELQAYIEDLEYRVIVCKSKKQEMDEKEYWQTFFDIDLKLTTAKAIQYKRFKLHPSVGAKDFPGADLPPVKNSAYSYDPITLSQKKAR